MRVVVAVVVAFLVLGRWGAECVLFILFFIAECGVVSVDDLSFYVSLLQVSCTFYASRSAFQHYEFLVASELSLTGWVSSAISRREMCDGVR